MTDKYISWRYNQAEPRPPVNPWADVRSCVHCKREEARKVVWNESPGSVNDWLELLNASTSFKECINWWENIHGIKWQKEEEALLRQNYLKHGAKTAAKEYWGEQRFAYNLSGLLGKAASGGLPADEQWFSKNRKRMP